jgi:hypothetical protein
MVAIRSRTPYSKDNQAFSDKGHLCAQRTLYPLIFPNSELQFVPLPEEQARTLDADMSTDRHVLVKVQTLREAFSVLVQERFRQIRFADFQDVTITEWHHNSNLPGELYKIKAEMFLYGYYEPFKDRFPDAIAFSVFNLKVKLSQGTIGHETGINPRSNQSFLCFKFKDLEKHHVTVWRLAA